MVRVSWRSFCGRVFSRWVFFSKKVSDCFSITVYCILFVSMFVLLHFSEVALIFICVFKLFLQEGLF